MFQSLVPNLAPNTPPPSEPSSSVFHDTNMQNPVSPGELLPLLPPSGGERPPEHSAQLFLETLLQHMMTTVIRLEWHDKASRQHRSFQFLLQQFKIYYLPHICPNFCYETSLYKPILGKCFKTFYLNSLHFWAIKLRQLSHVFFVIYGFLRDASIA